MNISGNNAIAMEGDKNARLVNNGTINLGTSGTTDTGMIGMQLDSGTTADAVIENNGVSTFTPTTPLHLACWVP